MTHDENEQIYAELQTLSDLGVIEYVVPTDPLGEEWVLGVNGGIVKITDDQAIVAFLAGVTAVTLFLRNQQTMPMLERIQQQSKMDRMREDVTRDIRDAMKDNPDLATIFPHLVDDE